MEIPSPCQPWTLYFVYDYDVCNCKLLSVECKERRATFCSVLFLSELDLIRSGWKMTTGKGNPPMAKKVSHLMEMFGDVRVDNYYWLRNDSRSNPMVLSYLKQENHYTHSIMSGTILLHFPSSSPTS